MNVTCPNCATIYRVDPAKVPESGVRARCAVCTAVFAVTNTAPSPPATVQPPRADVRHGPSRPRPSRPAPSPPAASRAARSRYGVSRPRWRRRRCRGLRAPHLRRRRRVSPSGRQRLHGQPRRHPGALRRRRRAPPASKSALLRRPDGCPGSGERPGRPGRACRPDAAPGRRQLPSRRQPAPRSPVRRLLPEAARPIHFCRRTPPLKARRLARALISDMVVYHPGKRQEGLRDGNLKELFEDEIKKSWEEYADQVGREVAESTGVLPRGVERDSCRGPPDFLT